MSAQAALGTSLALSFRGGDCWHSRESLEIVAGVTRGKLEGKCHVVAFSFYRHNLATESRLVISAPRQGKAFQDSDLNLGHIQPTAVLGDEMKLNW
jgi:hypothetical protein